MPRKRLTQRQQFIAARQQQKRIARAKNQAQEPEFANQEIQLGPAQEGVVCANFGSNVIVEDSTKHVFNCTLRQNLDKIVCGDRVIWQTVTGVDGQGVITALLERKSLLERPSTRGEAKPVAANIDQVFIVIAKEPAYQKILIDRYIVASEIARLKPSIIVNKVDTLSSQEQESIHTDLAIYPELGYPIYFFSAKQGNGTRELGHQLHGKVTILAGQSGVGKSSTIKYFLPEKDILIGDLSKSSSLGKHTTSTSMYFHLQDQGAIIDSPGVRDFGLWQHTKEEILWGFIEFRDVASRCRYRSCAHTHEPGCAIRKGVEDGELDRERYKNLLRITEGHL